LKFLLDVNVGTTIAEAVAGDGHDVVRVSLLTPRAEDSAILAQAVEEGRVLISYDSDFTDLIYRDGEPAPPAIIYIRFQPADVAALAPRILDVVANEGLQGHMVVIGPRETRRRPFPERKKE
jgi:predicted nuclease of predicted toxin-antitoxin system